MTRFLAPDDNGGGGAQPPAVAPPAATPPPAAPPPAATPPPAQAAGPSWATDDQGYDNDTRIFLAGKKYEKPGDAAKALLHAQKFLGAPPEEIERFGKDGLDDAARERIMARLGVPKSVDGYGLKAGESDDPDTVSWFGETALKHKLTPDQAKGVLADHAAKTAEIVAQQAAQTAASQQAAVVALKAKFGNQYDRNVSIAENVVGLLTQNGALPKNFLGVLAQEFGSAGVIEGFYAIAKMVGEDKFVTNTTPASNGSMQVAEAEAVIREMKSDPGFGQRMAMNTLTAKEKARWDQAHVDRAAGR